MWSNFEILEQIKYIKAMKHTGNIFSQNVYNVFFKEILLLYIISKYSYMHLDKGGRLNIGWTKTWRAKKNIWFLF